MESDLYQPTRFAVKHARMKKTWVVILVPSALLSTVRTILIGLVDGECQGRTALLKGGGRISVITPDTILEMKGSYQTLRMGWGKLSLTDDKALKTWESGAESVLSAYCQDFDSRSFD